MPERVHECVRSTLDDNPDMEESEAWAICHSQIDAEATEIAKRSDLDLETEALDEFVAETPSWQAVDSGWVNEEEGMAIYDPNAEAKQAEGFGVDVFRIVQAEDGEMDLEGDVMGIGVDFPNAGVYVDWRIDAWPEGEQLDEPHVSDYGSIDDLEQATGGVVEPLQTVSATPGEATSPDQGMVTFSGLSQEAVEAIERRYNTAVVDGEAPAAPTDS